MKKHNIHELLKSIIKGDVFKITFLESSIVEIPGSCDTFIVMQSVKETCDIDLIYGYSKEQLTSVHVVNMTNTVSTLNNCNMLIFAKKDDVRDTFLDNNVLVKLIVSLQKESSQWACEAFLLVVAK